MNDVFHLPVGIDRTIQLPKELWARLGGEKLRNVLILVQDNDARLIPLTMTLEDVRGSAPALPNLSDDLDDEIEEAMGQALFEKWGPIAHGVPPETEPDDPIQGLS